MGEETFSRNHTIDTSHQPIFVSHSNLKNKRPIGATTTPMKLKVATTMIMNIKHSFNKTRPQINVVTFCGISTDSERRVRSSNYGLFSNFDLRLNHKTIPRLLAELL